MSASIEPVPAEITDEAYPITVDLYEADNTTHVATLATDVIGTRQAQDAFNIASTAGVQVPVLVSDDTTTTVNTEATALTRGRYLRFSLNGTAVKSYRIRPRTQRSIDSDGNEKAQVRTVAPSSMISEWKQASVPPAAGTFDFPVDTRHFGWMSKENDISGMGAPTFLRPMFSPDGDYSEPWLDAFTELFDASTDRYFWFDDTVSGSAIDVAAHLGIKDQGVVWLNGVPMGQGAAPPESSWPKTRHGGASLDVGTHRWAFDIQGLPGASTAWFGALVYKIIDGTTGTIDGTTIRFRTGYSTGTTVYPQWKSSATPGGCTIKQAIRSVLTDIQDQQDLLLDVELDGADDTIDSNGNALDLIADFPVSLPMKGDDFLAACAAVHCDLAESVDGKTLYIYRWRERGTFHGATLGDPMPIFSGEVFGKVDGRIPNIVQLDHEERDS